LGIRTDPGGVALYWPAAETGFILESTPSLPAGTWTTVPTSVVGDERVAIEPLSGAPKFYRLRSSP
ncbi:MAG TPA: hypothetical protein VN673_06545, partial [Clostridia bacterium]|nr:hypothetical protein [Clostridia bacterium]